MERQAAIALGSNRGDRLGFLRRAAEAIAALPGIGSVQRSHVYETPALTLEGLGTLGDKDSYLNAVLTCVTSIKPDDLLAALLEIEAKLGRVPRDAREVWGPRPIDLDLLVLEGLQCRNERLTLPHPRITERWFVLKPLTDVWPKVVLGAPDSQRQQTAEAWCAALEAGSGASELGRFYAGPDWS